MLHIKIYGIVQGVGFRPFTKRLATEHNIFGTVANKGSYVEIFAEGNADSLRKFTEELHTRAPVRAAVLSVETSEIESEKNFADFSIIESETEYGKIFVSPDIAICDDCKRELYDKNNRRYLHPFINCTLCGPRLTIMEAAPYDRERTSMGDFPFCEECEREYFDETDRRYDAQPVCCNNCGPEYYILGGEETGADAIRKTREIIKNGGIAAIKGIGGFHLACDASNFEAVEKLRTRKRRPMKPFALMAKDFETLQTIVTIPNAAIPIITGPQKPILLLPRKKDALIAENVAKDNPNLGVMLPYAPIQCLLFEYEEKDDFPQVLVMTSGNPSGAPICHNDEEAKDSLADIADVILSNNRRIRLQSDDSVMGLFEGEPYMLRRSRGYAPIPITLRQKFKGEVLAIGGELKNSFCLAKDELFYPSPFIGDMSDLRSVIALKDSINLMESLLEIKPQIVACDLHPRYNTTAVSKELNLPLFYVQHHYAHILSCMAENNETGLVLGVAFDGTGYGTDGSIWGGEILLADIKGFERIAHIEEFIQAGGDKVPREGYRVALAFLYDEFDYDEEKVSKIAEKLNIADKDEVSAVGFMLKNKLNTVKSTSAGRLFDAASAILGIRKISTFEGEGAIYLEFAARRFQEKNISPAEKILCDLKEKIFQRKNTTGIIRTKYIVKKLLNGRLNDKNAEELAYFFHAALATEILSACLAARKKTKISKVLLSGGCFQNELFTSMTKTLLKSCDFTVLTHKLVPPNDGGIALGQALAAMAYLNGQF